MRQRLLIVLLLSWCANAGLAQTAATQPNSPIQLTRMVRDNPPERLFIVKVNLADPAVHVRLCRAGPDPDGAGIWETTLMQTSAIARREHLDVAVNGSYFSSKDFRMILGRRMPYFSDNWARACGFTMNDGQLWSAHPIALDFPSLVMADDGRATIEKIDHPPANARQIVSGCMLVVRNGAVLGQNDLPAPRCAVGLDAMRQQMVFMVVDGRRPDYSLGLSTHDLGAEMAAAGCADALCLDSGGSATLVMRQGEDFTVINRPSDGSQLISSLSVERNVANALGVVIDRPDKAHTAR